VQTQENLGDISMDHELRHKLLTLALAERKASGKMVREFDIDDLALNVDDVIALVGWVTEHLLYFFMSSLDNTQAIIAKQAQAFQDQLNKN